MEVGVGLIIIIIIPSMPKWHMRPQLIIEQTNAYNDSFDLPQWVEPGCYKIHVQVPFGLITLFCNFILVQLRSRVSEL